MKIHALPHNTLKNLDFSRHGGLSRSIFRWVNGLGREQCHVWKAGEIRTLAASLVDFGVTGMTKGHYRRLQDRPSHLLRPPGHLQYRGRGERQAGRANFRGECVPTGNEGSASGRKPKPLRGQAGTSLVATADIESVVLAWRSRPNPPWRVLRLMPTLNVRFRPHCRRCRLRRGHPKSSRSQRGRTGAVRVSRNPSGCCY